MEQTSHFARVLAFLEEKGWKYSYCCEDDCGSIDFEYRGVPYHIWEFHDGDGCGDQHPPWRPFRGADG